MKNFTKVLVLLAFFLFCHELSSQEWISTNGGRVYYFGYPMQLPEDNISPPESSKTIADYELIGEVSIESFEGISSIIGDVNSNGLPEVYIPSHNLITYFSELKVYEFSPDLSYTLYVFDQIKGWIWDIGDINNNGLADIIVQDGDPDLGTNGYLQIWEADPENNYWPTNKIKDITITGKKGFYFAKYVDLDKDGKMEVLISANSRQPVYKWLNMDKKLAKREISEMKRLEGVAI